MISTILLMATGFGLGLWYAKGKTDPARQFWRDARKAVKTACKTVKNVVRECQMNTKEEE